MEAMLFSPSILGGNFSIAGKEARAIELAGADMMHLDVMDGSFVPEITFGAKFIKDLRPISDLIFDVHLMIEKPENSIERFAEAGAGIITIHSEATNHAWRCLSLIKETGAEAGIAINPGTSVSFIEPLLQIADYVLVMTVNPGWGGQSFIPECVNKIAELDRLRGENGYRYKIEADGGISMSNIRELREQGLDVAVTGSAFFREDDKARFLSDMRRRAEGLF